MPGPHAKNDYVNHVPTTDPMLAGLELFFGDTSQALARVYARLETNACGAGCRLTGRLHGPHNRLARTLCATVPLEFAGDQGGLLARASLPDPCYWSPESPHLYRVHVELSRGDQVLARAERWLGIRPLGIRHTSLLFANKPWVPRGLAGSRLEAAAWSEWRAWGAAWYARDPDEDLCQELSWQGVPLVAELTTEESGLRAALQRLAGWPAAMIAILPEGIPCTDRHKACARNLLLCQRRGPAELVAAEARRAANPISAHVELIDARQGGALEGINEQVPWPRLIAASIGAHRLLEQARGGCDDLQRQQVARGPWAGYLLV